MATGIFKRGVQRYGRTPEPSTPYQRAANFGMSESARRVCRRATGG
jgi:type IV secretory pathway TrbF-like protein